MKLRLQAQNLQPGDIIGSGEVVIGIVRNGVGIPTNKVRIGLEDSDSTRICYWGKYTMINLERE